MIYVSDDDKALLRGYHAKLDPERFGLRGQSGARPPRASSLITRKYVDVLHGAGEVEYATDLDYVGRQVEGLEDFALCVMDRLGLDAALPFDTENDYFQALTLAMIAHQDDVDTRLKAAAEALKVASAAFWEQRSALSNSDLDHPDMTANALEAFNSVHRLLGEAASVCSQAAESALTEAW